ncbi:MAG: CHASE2 domain-containing protein [Kamptonema sp. SIO1D9]|nr:CHASE2 domain-containing protein [Kamptonema sp. SIO1D9]
MMGKLVVLTLEGNLEEQGFRVHLEIGVEGMRPDLEMTKELPANPELATHLEEHWLEKYRPLGAPYRIKPTEIINEGAINLRECQESAKQLEAEFKDWLEAESFREIDRELRSELSREEEIRVLIRTEDRQLQKLPWHLWDFVKSYGKAEVGLSPPEYRRTDRFQQITGKLRIRILAILGHQEGIDTQKDRQLLKKLPNAEVTFLVEPSYLEINDRLWEQDWDIIFFAGHSLTEGDEGRIYINPDEFITTDELWIGLKKAVERGLQLAIFNSCDGLGLAQRIGDRQIPLTIVMRELVPDRVAQEFLKYFLTAFASGESFYLAVRSARDRLRALEREFPCASWLPVICQNPATLPPTWEDLSSISEENSLLSLPHRKHTVTKKNDRRKNRSRWRKLRVAIIASLIITSLIMWGRWQGKLQTLELIAYDHLMQQRPIKRPDDRILVVRITPKDLEQLKTVEESQSQSEKKDGRISSYALDRLFAKLQKHQPRVIGLSIFRPGSVETNYPTFKTSLNDGNVIAICHLKSPEFADIQGSVDAPDDAPKERIGLVDYLLDQDGVIRRQLLWLKAEDRFPCKSKEIQSFSLKLAVSYLEKKGELEQFQIYDNFIKINNKVFKSLNLQTGGYHRTDSYEKETFQSYENKSIHVMLNYRPFQDYKKDIASVVTLTYVLSDQLTDDLVKDKIVIIGYDRETDRYKVPQMKGSLANEQLPGIFVDAQMVSHILSVVEGKQNLIWTWSWWEDTLWVWIWSITGATLTMRLKWYKLLNFHSLVFLVFVNGVAMSILYLLCRLVFLLKEGWIPLVPSILALLITGSSIALLMILQRQEY